MEKKKLVTNDMAHTSTEILETEMQNRYFSRYLKSSEARAISGRCDPYNMIAPLNKDGKYNLTAI